MVSANKLTLLFLILLSGASIARMVYFIYESLGRHGDWSIPDSEWFEAVWGWLHVTLFSAAMLINVFNWLYQTLRLDKLQTGQRRSQWWIHIIFVWAQSVIFLIYILIVIVTCGLYKDYSWLAPVFGTIYGSIFIIIGISFAVVGIRFYRKLKSISEVKARKIKLRLTMSIIIVWVCFVLRGVSNITTSTTNFTNITEREALREDAILLPILLLAFYLIVDIIPTVYQSFGVKAVIDEKNRQTQIKHVSRLTEPNFATVSHEINDSFLEGSSGSMM